MTSVPDVNEASSAPMLVTVSTTQRYPSRWGSGRRRRDVNAARDLVWRANLSGNVKGYRARRERVRQRGCRLRPMAAVAAVPPGLSAAEAAARLASDGPNAIGGSRPAHDGGDPCSPRSRAPLVLILVAASLVSLAVGDDLNAAIILAIVVMSAALGFVQEARSEAAVAALQARPSRSRRTYSADGTSTALPVSDVVRGDVVILDAGDIVPADGRVLDANQPLPRRGSPDRRGRGRPPRRRATATSIPRKDDDRDGLVFFGTSVVSGSGPDPRDCDRRAHELWRDRPAP